MKNLAFVFFFVVLLSQLRANDGEFYAEGSQLIPIQSKDISLKKEILHIKSLGEFGFSVNVYYELYNVGEEKNTQIGFEATAAQQEDLQKSKGQHPFINDFRVLVNEESVQYKTGITNKNKYIENGIFKINGLDTNEYVPEDSNFEYIHLYYFNAKLKKGINTIKHSYNFASSVSVGYRYQMSYILRTAARWANKQIDDFYLILDMGDSTSFELSKDFIKNPDDLVLTGIGTISGLNSELFNAFVTIYNGIITYNAKNYIPDQDIYIGCENAYGYLTRQNPENENQYNSIFNYKNVELPYLFENGNYFKVAEDSLSYKILRNYPFARRGFVFKTKEIQDYYEDTMWYLSNPNYTAGINTITEEEKKWMNSITIKK